MQIMHSASCRHRAVTTRKVLGQPGAVTSRAHRPKQLIQKEKGGWCHDSSQGTGQSPVPPQGGNCGFWGSVAAIHTELNYRVKVKAHLAFQPQNLGPVPAQWSTHECWGPVHPMNIPRLPGCASGRVLRVPWCIQQTQDVPLCHLQPQRLCKVLRTAEQRLDYPS